MTTRFDLGPRTRLLHRWRIHCKSSTSMNILQTLNTFKHFFKSTLKKVFALIRELAQALLSA